MTRVLILTASYGSGHNVAARSLAAAFERERTAVTVVDHFRELVHPLFDRASRTLYHGLLRRAPFLWGVGYSLGDWMASDSFLTLGVTRLGTKRLAALLDRLAPDVVVTGNIDHLVVSDRGALAGKGVSERGGDAVVTRSVGGGQDQGAGHRRLRACEQIRGGMISRSGMTARGPGVPLRAAAVPPRPSGGRSGRGPSRPPLRFISCPGRCPGATGRFAAQAPKRRSRC